MFSTFCHNSVISSSAIVVKLTFSPIKVDVDKKAKKFNDNRKVHPSWSSKTFGNIHLVYIFFSICHASRFRNCFLLQGLVIQAHLWLSPMVPLCGTLWHCRQSLIRICRDRQYLHDMFQHFPRKRNSRTVKFLTLVTNTLAFFVAGPWFLAYALNWKRESKYMFNQISASLTIWSVLTTNTKSQSVQRGLSCLSRQMSATEPLWRLVVGRTMDGACALERESITLLESR